jgi:AraC family transcriptional regulator
VKSGTRDDFEARFRRVVDHVDAHLGEALTVEQLARVAAYSKFHFHRQFSALFGVGVFEVVQLARLKRAAHELAYRPERPVIDVALDARYESPEAFARAFKRTTGQTPTEFRRQPDWPAWEASYAPVHEMRRRHMKDDRPREVKIVDFPETKVGVLEHRGDPRRIGETIRTFIAWRRENHLHPSKSATFNLLYGDPDTTPPEEFRLDLAAAVPGDGDVAPSSYGVGARTIPAGRCAVLRHVGSDDGFAATFDYLYREWLPKSGEEPRDFPLFLQRVKFFPDVPEHEAVTDVFLPLR